MITKKQLDQAYKKGRRDEKRKIKQRVVKLYDGNFVVSYPDIINAIEGGNNEH